MKPIKTQWAIYAGAVFLSLICLYKISEMAKQPKENPAQQTCKINQTPNGKTGNGIMARMMNMEIPHLINM